MLLSDLFLSESFACLSIENPLFFVIINKLLMIHSTFRRVIYPLMVIIAYHDGSLQGDEGTVGTTSLRGQQHYAMLLL
jgi:hypothetical protein